MTEKERLAEVSGETLEYGRQYLKQQYEYARLEVGEKTAKVSALILSFVVLFVLFGLVVLFGSLGLGLYLGRQWQSYSLAFGAITAFYLILAVIFLLLRKWLLTNPLLNLLLRKLLD